MTVRNEHDVYLLRYMDLEQAVDDSNIVKRGIVAQPGRFRRVVVLVSQRELRNHGSSATSSLPTPLPLPPSPTILARTREATMLLLAFE